MNQQAKGVVIAELEKIVHEDRLNDMAAALGTDTARATAAFVPYFGVAVAGQDAVMSVVQADFSRSLLVGHSYQWNRPFRADERVQARLYVEDVYERGANQFAVVATEFRDSAGELIQRQRTTFIEMARPATS